MGIVRAEWLRLRKRATLLLIAGAMPLLALFFFGLSYASIWDPGPFDEQQIRQGLIDGGYVLGLPPEEAERQLDEYVDNERRNHEQQVESVKSTRATFAFPQSLVTILGYASFLVLAVALLTATTIGDEFGWATIRTTLLANTHRSRVLLVRLGALVTVATLMVLLIVVVGALAPIALNVTSKPLPAVLPPIDIGALVIFILGLGLASYAVIAFATLATVLVRHGALTLVSVLVYVVVEGAILALLTRFKEFSFDFLTGTPGPLQWTLDFLPAHGFVTMMDVGARAARGPVTIPGFEMPPPPPISDAYVAMFGFVAWGTLFALLALWRFRRMDIVE